MSHGQRPRGDLAERRRSWSLTVLPGVRVQRILTPEPVSSGMARLPRLFRGRPADGRLAEYAGGVKGDAAQAPPYSTAIVRARRLPGGREEDDLVAVEEPLEIRIGGAPVAVTMRTPGHDEELALGFCLSEGLAPGRRAPARRPRREHGRGRRARLRPRRLRAQLLHLVVVRRLRQGRARGGRRRGAACRERPRVPARGRRGAPRPAARGAAGVRRDRRAARDRALRRARRARSASARTSAATTRWTRSSGWAFREGLAAARRPRSSASAAGSRSSSCRRRRSPAARSSSRSARRRASPSSSPPTAASRSAASCASGRMNVYTEPWRIERLTGVLLVGGASDRFGSPKALARFAARRSPSAAWRVLGEVCDELIAVGKAADGLELPFPVIDDGVEERAPVFGVLAGLRAAANDVCVVLPVDCPLVTPGALQSLGESIAVSPTGAAARRLHEEPSRCLERRVAAWRAFVAWRQPTRGGSSSRPLRRRRRARTSSRGSSGLVTRSSSVAPGCSPG